jgi:hypothetical protein
MNAPVAYAISSSNSIESSNVSSEPHDVSEANQSNSSRDLHTMNEHVVDSVFGETLCKTAKIHYVPLLPTLRNYLQQPEVWASCNQTKVLDGNLHDYTDGEIW